MEKGKWRIHEICKTCEYRETVGWSIRVARDWSNTCCTYSLLTEKHIDRTKVTDDFCPCYLKAEHKAKKYFF